MTDVRTRVLDDLAAESEDLDAVAAKLDDAAWATPTPAPVRTALQERLRHHPDGERIAWFGPPMSATSMATARMMETWAHGLDVVEALGVGHRGGRRPLAGHRPGVRRPTGRRAGAVRSRGGGRRWMT